MHLFIKKAIRTLQSAPLILILVTLSLVAVAADNKPEKGPAATEKPANVRTGQASYYHDKFQGRRTATGEIFNQLKYTCASNQFPLGTWLRITNPRNGKSVVVRVNDRMHPSMKRIVDLSKVAARDLGMERSGVAKVEVENLGRNNPGAVGS